jgi:hypothetical protein
MIDELLAEVRALGVDLLLEGDRLVISPASRVPDQLKARLRSNRNELIEALKGNAKVVPFPKPAAPKQTACRYDWVEGYRGQRLHCRTHKHGENKRGDNSIVFRMTWGGHDTLQDMASYGVLTGQALEDSRRLQ